MSAINSGSFTLEKEIVAALQSKSASVLANDAATSACSVFKEVQVYAGGLRIPDIVLVYRREKQGENPVSITYYEASILTDLFKHSSSTVERIAERLFCRVEDIEVRIRRLVKSGLVRKTALGFAAIKSAMPIGIRVVAIEAKLSRWQDALCQAAEYFRFANESYIAMPSTLARRTDILEQCAAAGVGVLAVDVDGDVSRVLNSDDNRDRSAEYLRIVSTTVGVITRTPAGRPRAKDVGGRSLFAD